MTLLPRAEDQRELSIVTKVFLRKIVQIPLCDVPLELTCLWYVSRWRASDALDILLIACTMTQTRKSPKKTAGRFAEEEMVDGTSLSPRTPETDKMKKPERQSSGNTLLGERDDAPLPKSTEKKRYSGDTTADSARDDRGEAGDISSGRGRVIQNKMWFYTFLLHTVAYFGGSGYINYLSISTDKQLITEGGQGPIDLCVLPSYGAKEVETRCTCYVGLLRLGSVPVLLLSA